MKICPSNTPFRNKTARLGQKEKIILHRFSLRQSKVVKIGPKNPFQSWKKAGRQSRRDGLGGLIKAISDFARNRLQLKQFLMILLTELLIDTYEVSSIFCVHQRASERRWSRSEEDVLFERLIIYIMV